MYVYVKTGTNNDTVQLVLQMLTSVEI